MGLRPEEMRALHEILHWGRVPGNNPILRFYGQTFEDFSNALRALFAQFKHVLPKGSNRVKVRMTGKDQLKPKEKELGTTLGDESTGAQQLRQLGVFRIRVTSRMPPRVLNLIDIEHASDCWVWWWWITKGIL